MSETEHKPTDEAMQKVIEARKTYAPIERMPLSPTGLGMNLKRDVRLITRKGATIKEGAYPILSVETRILGGLDFEQLSETFSNIVEDAKERGDYQESEQDGETVGAIKGDVSFTITLKPLEVYGKEIDVIEVLANLALEIAETEEEARLIFDNFFVRTEPPRDVLEADEQQGTLKPPISITTHPIDSADFPLDKVNANVWKLLEGAQPGQYGFDFGGEWVEVDEETGLIDVGFNAANQRDKANGIAVPLTYCIDFSELEDSITKKLEPYDKRVCIAVAALFNAGYETMTLQQVYNAMGYTGKIGKADKAKINDSITKMGAAKLRLDNMQEASYYNRATFAYDGNVIPMERIQALVNGQVVESAIHVFREPPPISFARERKQITTVSVKLLESPLSKTSDNIQLEDYLIERISRIKRDKGKTSNKILLETLYRNTGITTKKQKQRASGKITKLLEHYKACGFIEGYTLEADGVKIFY